MKEKLFRRRRNMFDRLRSLFAGDRAEKKREQEFLEEWTKALTEKAGVFNGLYGGLVRIQKGSAKKKEKILGEWWKRTCYQWEGETLEKISRVSLLPALETGSEEDCLKWTALLLEAARAAGITWDTLGETVLDERSTNAYVDWEGRQLYLGDRVEILFPACYQYGHVLEQGNCRR